MEQQKKEFTGVWIPKEVIDNPDLSLAEKILYAEIACFPVCYMLNSTFAERLGVSERTVSKTIRSLLEKGYVYLVKNDGRKRYIKAVRDFPVTEITEQVPQGTDLSGKIVYADQKILLPSMEESSNRDNNRDNNKDIAEQSSENITTNSGSSPPLTEKSNLGGRTDFVVERIHEESGEPISPRKKPNTWEREKSVFAAFAERCRTELGTEPEPAKIWQLKQIRNVLERYTEDQLADVFDEWFATANDEVILNIHSALSAQNLNRLKLKL